MATLLERPATDIAPGEAKAVRKPLENAAFLPPRVYADKAIFDEEISRVFRANWLPVCHISQLDGPGSYLAREMFGEPIVVTRDKDDVIRVMSNVCRHRNAVLSSGAGACKGNRMICPYHGWTYGLDGRLLAAPFMDQTGEFTRSEVTLPQLKHEIWEGFIFVNFSGDAPPLNEQLQTLTPKVRPYGLDRMKAIEVRRARVDWNWKISLENFSEAYHQPFIHPITADRDFPATDTVYEDTDGPWSIFWLYHRNNEVAPTVAPAVADMPESYYRGFSIINVYPLLHMLVDAATPLWMDWVIHDVNDHELIWYMMAPYENVADAKQDRVVKDFLAFIEPILMEDVEVCRAVSRGVQSSFAQPGRLSYMEKVVHQFQQWWLNSFERR